MSDKKSYVNLLPRLHKTRETSKKGLYAFPKPLYPSPMYPQKAQRPPKGRPHLPE